MTPERLREIANNCEDTAFVASETNARELRELADLLERVGMLGSVQTQLEKNFAPQRERLLEFCSKHLRERPRSIHTCLGCEIERLLEICRDLRFRTLRKEGSVQ